MADSTEIHEIKGVGAYAVPPSSEWHAIESFIREQKLGFAPNRHALFDSIIADLFPTLGKHDLTGAMNGGLRANLASIRNHLFVHYFEEAPEGMTPEKMRENLRFIARFVGEGLQWDEDRRAGKPADPFKTEIHLDAASAAEGAGAHYLYKKIREMNRHSNWVKPFADVLDNLSGKTKDDLTTLLEEAPFAPQGQTDEERYREKEEEAATDLDILGDQLIHGAARAGAIGNISEPVRREAIDLAKEILNKLKIKLGSLNIIDGLNIKPEDTATMGSISGVLAMFDRLLAYAKSIDPSILMHPAIMSAIQAFGQIGYLNKQEAMRLATSSKNNKMAERIAGQLKRTSAQFNTLNDKSFGALTDRINKGIDTVLEKTQSISGPSALVGHSISQNISSFMTAAPTAGMANKVQQTSQRTVANQKGEEAAERAAADRMLQAANQAAQRSNREQQQETSRKTNNARQSRQQAQQRLKQSQQLQQQRASADHSHDHDHNHQQSAQQQQQKTAADVAKQLDPRILMGFQNATNTSNIKTGMVTSKNAKDAISTSLQGTNASGSGSLKPPTTPARPANQPPLMPGTTERGSMANAKPGDNRTEAAKLSEDQQKKRVDNEMLMQPPPPPPNRGGGRGM